MQAVEGNVGFRRNVDDPQISSGYVVEFEILDLITSGLCRRGGDLCSTVPRRYTQISSREPIELCLTHTERVCPTNCRPGRKSTILQFGNGVLQEEPDKC